MRKTMKKEQYNIGDVVVFSDTYADAYNNVHSMECVGTITRICNRNGRIIDYYNPITGRVQEIYLITEGLLLQLPESLLDELAEL